jgi:hypothetical protein
MTKSKKLTSLRLRAVAGGEKHPLVKSEKDASRSGMARCMRTMPTGQRANG